MAQRSLTRGQGPGQKSNGQFRQKEQTKQSIKMLSEECKCKKIAQTCNAFWRNVQDNLDVG